ncbi:uncharacterized protein C8Q71DRAFT_752753 [Rhodofomes roseus]|uniref:Uncharacterized protein n=1 Tax=Rhodofomes roseus TaxID=34475 RepID=A0ABQ8KKV8_9APHY|nr:uncharacterized protein C8Q71DRAFT_752753 [Rhodofomes roseus]KAH9838745.1 hypothetical protein C8Q71DRAFT_752753 [Rhodofomes roseus]
MFNKLNSIQATSNTRRYTRQKRLDSTKQPERASRYCVILDQRTQRGGDIERYDGGGFIAILCYPRGVSEASTLRRRDTAGAYVNPPASSSASFTFCGGGNGSSLPVLGSGSVYATSRKCTCVKASVLSSDELCGSRTGQAGSRVSEWVCRRVTRSGGQMRRQAKWVDTRIRRLLGRQAKRQAGMSWREFNCLTSWRASGLVQQASGRASRYTCQRVGAYR